MHKLKSAKKGAEKSMPLHKRIATGNAPKRKPGKIKGIDC